MEGRTYRYFKDAPLYPFGYGLSYTTFEYSNLILSQSEIEAGEDIEVSVCVKNIGEVPADEVVQVYIRDNKSNYVVANHSLCGFKRVSLDIRESKTIRFVVAANSMSVVRDNGERIIEPGEFTIFVGGQQPDERSFQLIGKECLKEVFVIK